MARRGGRSGWIARVRDALPEYSWKELPAALRDEFVGGVFGELTEGAFNAIGEALVKDGLWTTRDDGGGGDDDGGGGDDDEHTCLDFGHGLGRFALTSRLFSRYRCRWIGVDVQPLRQAFAATRCELAVAAGLVPADAVQFYIADFFALASQHPAIAEPTLVVGYDVWLDALPRETKAATMDAYVRKLTCMPHLRAVVSCCHRSPTMAATMARRGFVVLRKLYLAGANQHALLYARDLARVPPAPAPMDADAARADAALPIDAAADEALVRARGAGYTLADLLDAVAAARRGTSTYAEAVAAAAAVRNAVDPPLPPLVVPAAWVCPVSPPATAKRQPADASSTPAVADPPVHT